MEGGSIEIGVQMFFFEGGLSILDMKFEGFYLFLKGLGVDLFLVDFFMLKVFGFDFDMNLKGLSLKGDLGVFSFSMKLYVLGFDFKGVGGKVYIGVDGVKMLGIDVIIVFSVGVLDVILKGLSLQGDLVVFGDIKCFKVFVVIFDVSLEVLEGVVKFFYMKLFQFGIFILGFDLDINIKGL